MRPRIRDSREVFVLGSGFSRAIAEQMPVVGDLSASVEEAILITLSAAKRRELPPTDDFEALLGFLAAPQPFLYQADSLENQALS